MRVLNPFQMNDWNIRRYLIVIISLQLLVWGIIGLDWAGLKISLLRQILPLIYLLYIPGNLILRILKLHNLECTENILYSVGLSITVVMFTGFFANVIYQNISILKPISIIPLIFTLSFFVLGLCTLCYVLDDNFSNSSYLDLKDIFSNRAMLLYLLPFLTVLGTYFVNFNENNSLLMIVIFSYSLVIVACFLNLFTVTSYPRIIFLISISLLLHNSLISMYLWGWDIQFEYYAANNVLINSLWNYNIFANINAMLSIVMFAPIISKFCALNLIWVFKIIYPLIFSLVPVGLYYIFRKQTNSKIALMSVFFFISYLGFYTEMLELARQQIAEFYMVLMLLLITDDKLDEFKRRILLIIFSFSVVVSHYAISYIFVSLVAGATLVKYIYLHFHDSHKKTIGVIDPLFALLYVVFLISWYVYVSNSSPFYSITHLIRNVVISVSADLFNPEYAQGLYILTKKLSCFKQLLKYLHIITQICISIGLIYSIFNKEYSKMFKFNKDYLLFSSTFFIILLASIVIPNFSSALNTSRVYQISLLLLSPFCVLGGILICRAFHLIYKSQWSKIEEIRSYRILSLFFAIFLLFNTGWVHEVMNDNDPLSISLSKFDYPKFNGQDNAGKEWIYFSNNLANKNGYIYADNYRWLIFANRFGKNYLQEFPEDPNHIQQSSFIYLSTYNSFTKRLLFFHRAGVNYILSYTDVDKFIKNKNEVYNNGGATVYYW